MSPLGTSALAPVLRDILGQPRAQEILQASIEKNVHAYLFVGPAGTGKLAAARSFATALVCPNGGCGSCASCHDAVHGLHPDITVFEREGASISVDDAHEISLTAQRSPNISSHQVLILNDFHLVAGAAPALLKTIEEPPPSTVFLVVADALPGSLVTIASRCVSVAFFSIGTDKLIEILISDGVELDLATLIAKAALGNLDRARLLVGDPGFRARQAAWRSTPDLLEGTGASVAKVVAGLMGSVDEIVDVLKVRQASETTSLAEAANEAGERRVRGQKMLEDRHKREQRRVRTDELRAGLASLASVYLQKLSGQQVPPRRVASLTKACHLIDEAAKYLSRNPNETLLLQALFIQLGDLAG
jgi:DNA polymerase-3 subunit delta'